MRLHTFLAAIALTLVSALGLSAQSVRVIFVSGQASLQSPGETNLRPVTKGEVVTLGTRIVTGGDGRVALTPMPGVKSLITPNTDLVLESATETRAADGKVTTAATLDLKQGAVVTDLIKQEGVTYDYNIRTPRGLAGARGTNYTVAVNSGGLETILVSHGTIIFNLLDGRSLSVTAGQIQISDATGSVRSASTLGALSASDQAIAQEIAEKTLNALESALDAGLKVNPEAVSQALDLFESFGLDLSASTLDTMARLRAKLNELIAATSSEASTIVTEVTNPPATLDSFVAGLTPAQAAAFAEIISLGGFNNTDPVFLARFADPAFTKALLDTVNLYVSLSPSDRSTVATLGILGNANLAALGADSSGLARMVAAYTNLNLPSPLAQSELDYPATSTTSAQGTSIFFPGTSGASGQTIYNGLFSGNTLPANLYVGATQYFRLANTAGTSPRSVNFSVAPGADVEIRAADEVSLTGTAALPISFSADLRGILMEAVTLNLSNVSFPEGSVVSLTSRDGGFTSAVNHRITIPNFGSSRIGRVNFLGGVYYGSNLLDSDSAFVTGSRGNIAIHAFADGTNLGYPAYTYPPGTYGAFVASLTTAQAAAFADIISLGGFSNTDPAFLAKFSDSTFTSALVNTIDLYISLPAADRTTAVTLGILGNSNTTAIGTDSTGLARLLASYTTLLGNTTLPAPSYQSEGAYPSGTNTPSGSNNVFFNGSSGLGGQMLYNASFGDTVNPGDLYIGATRFFYLANDAAFSSTSVNFNVSPGLPPQNGGTTTPPVAAGNTGGNVEIRAGEGIKLAGLAAVPVTFSADTRNILMESITINLANVNFPEGSLVNLTSRDGGVTSSYDSNFKIPNFGSSTIGRVNFLGGVYYGSYLLDSDSAFVTGSRGNIAIHAFADGTNLGYPAYTYPPGTYGAFVASLTTAQAAAFADIISLGGFSNTDPAFLAKFSDSTFTSALVNTIDLYISLPAADRSTAVALGILGNANTTAIGTDSTGLARLLATYTTLLGNTTLPAPSFENEADYTAGSNFGAGSNNVFFNGSSGLSGQMLYNGVFGDLVNPGDLYVGATRFFRLSNDGTFNTSPNFNVRAGLRVAGSTTTTTTIPLSGGANTGGDVYLYAGEGIELAGQIATPITFSADTRNILMESITINLGNVNFPEGSTVALVSRDGGNAYTVNGVTYTVPNFNSRVIGKVNFLGGVFYGTNILDSEQAYVDGSRGNIAIFGFNDGLTHIAPAYAPVPLTAEQIYMATLTPSQLAIFTTLPADIRTKLVTLNDTDLTGVMLAVDPSNGLVHTASGMGRYLDAFTALSTQARAFFKTLGGATGSGFTNIDGAPDLVRWSATAIETAATNFNSMDPTSQGALVSLGAGDTIVGLNADYTTGLVAALASDIPSVIEAGWGRYLHNLVNDSVLSDINNAAKNATSAQRDFVNRLDLDPYSLASILEANVGDPTPIYNRINLILGSFTTADLDLLASLGYHDTFSLFSDTDANTLANLTAVIANYNSLTPSQQDAARALRMGSVLVDSTRAASLADFYLGLTFDQQDAMRETGLFSAFYGPNPNDSLTQANIISALNAYLGLSPTVQNYLLAEGGHDNLLPILTSTATTDNEGHASRSLADIVYILSNAPTDIGTLLDMDIAPAILYSGYLDGASPAEVTASLGNAVIFYQSLTASQQGTLRGLGIMGSGHVGYLGADYAGVQRLLTAYDNLPLALRIDTQRIDETIGDSHKYKNHPSYFFPFNKDTTHANGAMVEVTFDSPADLYVGAVRRLRIDNSTISTPADTFTVPLDANNLQAYDIHLAAGDLIDLNNTPVSYTARGIVMDAITINLSKFNFQEGTVAALNSRDGGTADGSTGSGIYPHWGSSAIGRVNFLTGVTYGLQPMDNINQFDANARGNIAIGSHVSPASLPAYTPPSTVITNTGL